MFPKVPQSSQTESLGFPRNTPSPWATKSNHQHCPPTTLNHQWTILVICCILGIIILPSFIGIISWSYYKDLCQPTRISWVHVTIVGFEHYSLGDWALLIWVQMTFPLDVPYASQVLKITRWWFQTCFMFHSYLWKWSNLTSIFFKWVGPTTN